VKHRVRGVRGVAVAALVGLSSIGVVAATAGAQATTDPGITDTSVKIGFISSESGVASSTGKGSEAGCKARVGRANAEGGVNGRKIQVEYIDDQSSPGNLDNAKDLVQNRNVFAVVDSSALAFFSYRYLVGAGVPMIGGGYDGTYYYDRGNESVISGLGNGSPVPGLTFDYGPKWMKKMGATKMGAVGYGISPSSSESARATYQYGAQAAGMRSTYLNTNVDFGATDVGPVVLGIKNSGADALYFSMNPETGIAILQGLAQNGYPVKAAILASGYGQDVLDSPAAKTLTPQDLFLSTFRPVETGGKAVKQFRSDLKKYGSETGVPGWGNYTGYVTCDILVTGLQGAGKDLTRKGFIDAIRTPGDYDGAGLTCQHYDFSLKNFGKINANGCAWLSIIENGKFKVLNGGKPLTGKLVGDPQLLAQYSTGASTTPTTTAGG
jgi:ABC-type branched-subunit amino acid transport system substrate-binding protein